MLPQLIRNCYQGRYAPDEIEAHKHITRADSVGFFVCIALYYIMAKWWGVAESEATVVPPAVIIGRLLLATATGYLWYVDSSVVPKPTKEYPFDYEVARGPVGKFIFLTHQTNALHFVHQLASLLAVAGGGSALAAGVTSLSWVSGPLACFVTVQYFLLVRGDDVYQQSLQFWASRGVHMAALQDVVHAPHLLIVVVDICLVRHRATLLALRPSVAGLFAFIGGYTLVFLALVHAVHHLRGTWPYGLFHELGTDASKWAKFVGVQVSILVTFHYALLALAATLPAAW